MYLLVDNYDSFTYNIYALFIENGCDVEVVKNSEPVKNKRYKGIILSPGPSTPENSGTTLDYLEKYFGKIPFFGVCLGMQALGFYMGYKIRQAKTIRHGKKEYIIKQSNSILLNGLPERFISVRYHSLAVECDSKLVTSHAAYDGEYMSIEDKDRYVFGVQFHPESYMSHYGLDIVKNYTTFCEGVK